MSKQEELWIEPLVAKGLDIIKKRVLKKDLDFVAIIDGEEGVGKSVLAQQIAQYLDPEFGIDNIVFNSDQFLQLIKNPKIKKGTCIVLDEAYSAANSRASLSDINRAMIGVATEMRQKNLFVLLCIPSFFDLDRYFALWRCKSLFHVYFTANDERRYLVFSRGLKTSLYLNGKKTYSYKKPYLGHTPFSFPNFYTVNEQEYRLRKAQAFNKRTVSHQARKWLAQRNAYARYILENLGLSQEDVGKIPSNYGVTSLSHRQISTIARQTGSFDEET